MTLLVFAVIAACCGALLTRGGIDRRLPAAVIPLALLMLARPPRLPWPGAPTAALPGDATLADIEAVLDATSNGADIELTGNGVHPELLPLLAERAVRWDPSDEPVGLADLAWPRRVAVGEPIQVRGRVDVRDSVLVRLVGPDGTVDSARTDSAFRFEVVPRAPGRWTMQLLVGASSTTLGVRVMPPPRLRVLVIAGRPDFEVPALVRRLVAQDADVSVRTRMTRDRDRVEQWGRTPPPAQLSKARLDSLDLVVLASGGLGALSATEQRLLVGAVDSGLGVLHLGDDPVAVGPLAPFVMQRTGTERTARLLLDSILAVGSVRINALSAHDSLAYLRDSLGRGVAWSAARGLGSIGATAINAAHRLALAGHPDTEATWWAALIGPLLRSPAGRWLVNDSAMVVRDEPLTVEWLGPDVPTASIQEAVGRASARLITATGERPALRLWPRDTGWISIAGGGDTLDLLVSPEHAFPGLVVTARRRAFEALEVPEGRSATETGRRPLPRLAGLALLLGAVALAWRPR